MSLLLWVLKLCLWWVWWGPNSNAELQSCQWPPELTCIQKANISCLSNILKGTTDILCSSEWWCKAVSCSLKVVVLWLLGPLFAGCSLVISTNYFSTDNIASAIYNIYLTCYKNICYIIYIEDRMRCTD